MLAGQKRVKVQIWRNVQIGVNDHNEPIYDDQMWRETFAEMRARRGNEHHDGSQVFALTQWFLKFRWHSVVGVDGTYWLVINGQKYDIRNIDPDFARKRFIEIEARVANINMADGTSSGIFALLAKATENFSDATVDDAFSWSGLDISGGLAPYVVAVDNLPDGLSVASATGIISGTPTEDGDFGLEFAVTDANGDVVELPPLTLTVLPIWILENGVWSDNGYWQDSVNWSA